MTKYDFQERIAFFLISKGLNVGGSWSGKMKKAEQVAAFGAYLGKGTIEVCGTSDTVLNIVSICYGADCSIRESMSSVGFFDRNDNITPLANIVN